MYLNDVSKEKYDSLNRFYKGFFSLYIDIDE
jgi:hypothetical protein